VYWLVLAALGDALIAIVGCAGLLAGVWLIARSSRAGAGVPASGAEPPEIAPVPGAGPAAADEPAPDDPPATTFRHGTIRLASAPARDDAASTSESQAAPSPWPALAPEPRPALAPAPAPESETEPEPPFVPPPLPVAPRTSFRQGPIRLGGLERGGGSRRPADEPPDEPPDAAA
jgi:hypothetical protein